VNSEISALRITGVTGYRLELPFRDAPYTCSGGRSAMGFDSLIVRLHTNAGLEGWGEMAPLGAFYDAAFAAGARAALAELAPVILGQDPTQIEALGRRMDFHLKGHAYTKSAIDMACWDLLGKRAQLPLAELLGGRYGERVELYRSIAQQAPPDMAVRARAYQAAGYRRIQVKVGLDPDEDIERIEAVRSALGADVVLFADANGGWLTHQARRFLRATRNLDYHLEQPCATYEECRALRADCDRPLVLDESITDLATLLQAHADGAADAVTIKIARVGGITKARLLRDVAVECGLAVTVEDTGGAEIDTAAMVHLSLSTPATHRLHTCDFHNWVTVSNASGIPAVAGGTICVGRQPGLGVEPRVETFPSPFLSQRES
jgi:L-alanine-DL-glutamate epimerase-like enolase superfamily enzyme